MNQPEQQFDGQPPAPPPPPDTAAGVPGGQPGEQATPIPSEIEDVGIVIVDHGSKRAESNEMLIQFVDQFRRVGKYRIVEPAHMELAEPSIATSFDRCVERGARTVVVSPYFLLPGKHWHSDIPRLAGEAAAKYSGSGLAGGTPGAGVVPGGNPGGVRYLVTAPIGLHPLMIGVIQSRVDHCLDRASGRAAKCDVCLEGQSCGFVSGDVAGT